MISWFQTYFIQLAIGAVVALVVLLGVQTYRVASIKTDLAESKTELADLKAAIAGEREKFEAEARATEQRHAKAIAAVNDTHAKEMADAREKSAAVVADLRAGTRRLQSHWQGCVSTSELSRSAASLASADEGARLRAESAGRIIGAAAEADAQIRALQGVIRALYAEAEPR